MPIKGQRISVYLPQDIITFLRRVARKRKISRSKAVVEIVRVAQEAETKKPAAP